MPGGTLDMRDVDNTQTTRTVEPENLRPVQALVRQVHHIRPLVPNFRQC